MAKVGRPKKCDTTLTDKSNAAYDRAMNNPLIKAFDDNFWVIPHDGGYCLYDKSRYCKRANAQYLGKFYISSGGNRYVFRENYYEDIKNLVDAMDKYNVTLPFSAEIYDPTWRKHAQIQMAAYDYLEKLGFKSLKNVHNLKDIYYLNDAFEQKIFELEIDVKHDTSVGFVRRLVYQNKHEVRIIEAPFIDIGTMVKAINSQIATYTTMIQAQLLNLFKDMSEDRASIILDNTYDIKNMSNECKDAREQSIEYLEKELKRLKGE